MATAPGRHDEAASSPKDPSGRPSPPPVMNMPGAEGTQARHWTDAAADGKQKDVMQVKASLSTSRIPLWRLDTVSEKERERERKFKLCSQSFLVVAFFSTNHTAVRIN